MVFECWRPVRGYIGLYLVSDKGRVKNQRTGKVLKPNKIKGGYLQVILNKNGFRSSFLVHRLVMSAFKYDCPSGFEVDHRDFNPENNNIENLRYLPSIENRARHSSDTIRKLAENAKNKSQEWETKRLNAIKNITKTQEWRKKHAEAVKRACCKPVNQFTMDGVFVKTWPSAMEVERELGISSRNLSECCSGKRKSVGGFKWEKKEVA